MISDREMLRAIFDLVGTVAMRLGGQRPIVPVRDENGDVHYIYPVEVVTFADDRIGHIVEAESQTANPLESAHKLG